MKLLHRFRRVMLLFVLPQLFFLSLSYYTDDIALKRVFNIIEQALSAGICVAYLPGTVNFLLSEGEVDSADWLGFGIVLTWSASFCSALFSIIWLANGQPMSWINSDFVNYIKYMYICGGICHLLAPGALKERLPTQRWIQLGIVVAAATLLGLAAVYAANMSVQVSRMLNSSGVPRWSNAVAGPAPSSDETEIDIFREAMPVSPEVTKPVAPPVAGKVRVESDVSPEFRARIEQSRVANGDRSIAAAVRRLLARALAAEDRDALGPYEPGKR